MSLDGILWLKGISEKKEDLYQTQLSKKVIFLPYDKSKMDELAHTRLFQTYHHLLFATFLFWVLPSSDRLGTRNWIFGYPKNRFLNIKIQVEEGIFN